MATEVLDLPADIPIIQVETSGYVVSTTPWTALRPTGMPECGLSQCALRGDRVPRLTGGYEVIARAEKVATELEEAEEWRGGRPTGAPPSVAHVFEVSYRGGIAVPPDDLARAMARGTDDGVWETLRPRAHEGEFHGIDLPMGRIIFRDAQGAGHYKERLLVSVPSLRYSGAIEGV